MDSDDDLEFAVEELMKSGSALHPRNRSTSFLISLAIGIGGYVISALFDQALD